MVHVTDYDVWHATEEPVTVEAVIRVLLHNADVAKAAVRHAVHALAGAGPSPQADALQDAIITDHARIRASTRARVDLLIGRFLT